MSLTRRHFIGGLLGAGAATAVSSIPAGAAILRPRVPLRREEHRVVIIGSGFGGGVSALRLAEAGVTDILVLERGKRWPTGPNANTFPSPSNGFKHVLWYGSAPTPLPGLVNRPLYPGEYAGLIEAHVSPNMHVLNAAGVGGGSLAYQGMTLQPSQAVFEETFPAGLDYTALDQTYYPRVARMLQVAAAPDALVNTENYRVHRVFRRRALAAGYGVDTVPMPIDWNYALAELRGEMKASYTNADGSLGINNGGKHTVDVTYLAQAEATGRVTVKALHLVRRIARLPNGHWRVEVDRTDVRGQILTRKIITTPTLILAAGSVNTTKLLLRAQHEDAIRDLPDRVGAGWGSNGDRIVTWTAPTEEFGKVQGGPVVYASKEWDKPAIANTIVQAAIPAVAGVADHHSTVLVGYGVSNARGHWTYLPAIDDVTLSWKHEADAVLHKRVLERLHKIAGPLGVIGDTFIPAPMTWHPLGGACMEQVCDLDGRVQGQRGLYVLDGALMPGTTAACNPSMTITALAERALDNIVRTDVGTQI